MQARLKKNLCKPFNGKPYNFFGDYLREKYGCMVVKLPVNASLSCPNRDGTIGIDGCIFCSESGSASHAGLHESDIIEQMEAVKRGLKRTPGPIKYIAYFQAFTNTYGEISKLKALYDKALSVSDVTGIMIGTRPDCVTDEALDLLCEYKSRGLEVVLEIGMQTMHDKSLEYLHRGHTHEQTRKAILAAAQKNIDVCVHIILGIPGETWHDMMQTAEEISSLPVSGVKIHHLHVIKDTALEKLYREKQFTPISYKDYISAITDFIERLRPDILIHRLFADQEIDMLVAPTWSLKKGTVVKRIEDEFEKRCTYQGFLCERD